MNLSKIVGATLTTAGCYRGEELKEKQREEQRLQELRKQEEKEQKEISKIQAHIESALAQRKKDPYSLKNLRDKIPGIHLFDGNKNNILDLEEIDLFIKAIVNKNSEKYTKEGLEKLLEVKGLISKQSSREYQFRRLNFYSDESWTDGNLSPRTRIETERHRYTPDNITQTLNNMSIKCREYEEKLREQTESEIQKQINQALKK